MTDREIDALVAEKIMGWGHAHGWEEWTLKGQMMAPSEWSPSTNIAAAWQVVEKIMGRSEDWRFDLQVIGGRPAPGRVWAKFRRWTGPDEFVGYDNTVPRAICLAALKSLGAGEK